MSSKGQNIRVAVRVRPMNNREYFGGETNIVSEVTKNTISIKDKANSTKTFTFDRIFCEKNNQIEIYDQMVYPLVAEVINGYNCTVFAYGQTGTGKTYTITGKTTNHINYTLESDPCSGIIPRALCHLFDIQKSKNLDLALRVSFLEIYNEEIFDLLSDAEKNCRLAIYDDLSKKGSIIVKDIREISVRDKNSVLDVLNKGLAKRITASTNMNAQSSRSHAIFSIMVHIKELDERNGEEFLRIGKFNLVDLAGSECVGKSGALDMRLREAGSINQSLLTLRRVIAALVDRSPHIPYRESKLTRLLQDSLGGRTKTSIIATISPGSKSLEETLATLDYAHRAKNIENKPEINVKINKLEFIKNYNMEMEQLRRDLEAARSKNGMFVDEENYKKLQSDLIQQQVTIETLDNRREYLEAELKKMTEIFGLRESELTQLRVIRDSLSAELKQLSLDLVKIYRRLQIKHIQLQETDAIRREHRQTEENLREQALAMRSGFEMAANDVGFLQERLNTFASLSKRNKDLLYYELPVKINTDYLHVPLAKLQNTTHRIMRFVSENKHSLTDFEEWFSTSCINHKENLVDIFENFISLVQKDDDEFHFNVNHGSLLINSEFNSILEDKLPKRTKPAIDGILSCITDIENIKNTALEQLNINNSIISKMMEELVDFHVAVDDSLIELGLLNQTHNKFRNQSLENIKEQRKIMNAWFDNQESELASLKQNETHNCNIIGQRLNELRNIHTRQTVCLSDLKKSCKKQEDFLVESHFNSKKSHESLLDNEMVELKLASENEIKDLKSLLEENLTLTIHRFIKNRLENWDKIKNKKIATDLNPELESIYGNSIVFHNAIESFSEGITKDLQQRLKNLETNICETTQVLNEEITTSSEELATLPEFLINFLKQKYEVPETTGMTPKRTVLKDYPGSIDSSCLARTSPYRNILSRIREKETLETLNLDDSVIERTSQRIFHNKLVEVNNEILGSKTLPNESNINKENNNDVILDGDQFIRCKSTNNHECKIIDENDSLMNITYNYSILENE